MSMLFDLRRISQAQVDALLADPGDIFFFLHGEACYEPPKGLFGRIFGDKSAPVQARQCEAPAEGTRMELGKDWHLLHSLPAMESEAKAGSPR